MFTGRKYCDASARSNKTSDHFQNEADMKTYEFELKTAMQTEKFGRALGKNAEPGDVICLDGDLGAGKTTLSQAVARGLEVPEDCYVTSPSFAIFHEYPGRLPMYHMDFYRLQDYTEVEDLGFEEYFYLSGLTVIEWSKRAEEILPDSRLHLEIEICDENSRKVTCSFDQEHWGDRLTQILHEAGLNN